MKVKQLMSDNLGTVSETDNLDCAARIMWEKDCGIVPVVDATSRVVGMITDRDICIAAYTQNKVLKEIPVAGIGTKQVVSVRPDDSADEATELMQKHQVRRLAVTDERGCLVGLVSLNDLARRAGRDGKDVPQDGVAKTLAAISQPRA
jgi:CBS domain-containing protein